MLKELRDIKMLLVLQLVTAEVKQRTIAQFLGVSEATVSRMLPAGGAKRKGAPKGHSVAEGKG
jgi:predicted transcriptional regulator